MICRLLAMLACLWVASADVAAGGSADPQREVHGMSDAFAAPGVALAWGVLRGGDESATSVVIRVAADPAAFQAVAVAGVDPFTQRSIVLLPPSPTAGGVNLRVPRAHFADFPRSEVRLYAATPATPPATPSLVVYYLGVPDTTPEFAAEAALDAYLADRIARVRATTGGKPP